MVLGSELAEEIANEGYNFTIYVPYGDDWFAYFMRRLAERPQNLSLAAKEFVKPAGLKTCWHNCSFRSYSYVMFKYN